MRRQVQLKVASIRLWPHPHPGLESVSGVVFRNLRRMEVHKKCCMSLTQVCFQLHLFRHFTPLVQGPFKVRG